ATARRSTFVRRAAWCTNEFAPSPGRIRALVRALRRAWSSRESSRARLTAGDGSVESTCQNRRGRLGSAIMRRMVGRVGAWALTLFIVPAAGWKSKPGAYNCHDVQVEGGEPPATACLPTATACNQSRVETESVEKGSKTTKSRPETELWCFDETIEGTSAQ